MKKFLVLLFLASFVFGQDRVAPNYKPGGLIFDAVLVGATAGTFTDAFPIFNVLGSFSVFMKGDTTIAVEAAQLSDSCLTVGLALKDNDIGWGVYYSAPTATNYFKLDTVARTLINTAGGTIVFMDLAQFTGWQSADSAKLWLQIGTGDSLNLDISYGGH